MVLKYLSKSLDYFNFSLVVLFPQVLHIFIKKVDNTKPNPMLEGAYYISDCVVD